MAKDGTGKRDLKYLAFDSKFTNYQNLRKLDDQAIKVYNNTPQGEKYCRQAQLLNSKSMENPAHRKSRNKKATIKAIDETIFLKGLQ